MLAIHAVKKVLQILCSILLTEKNLVSAEKFIVKLSLFRVVKQAAMGKELVDVESKLKYHV